MRLEPHPSAMLGAGEHTPGAIGSELMQGGAKTQESQAKMPKGPPITPMTEASLTQRNADDLYVQ